MDKNNIMMIAIIVLLVILLGTIGFVSIYAIRIINGTGENSGSEFTADGEATVVPQDKLLLVDYTDAVTALMLDAEQESHALTFMISIGIDNREKKAEKDMTELSDLLIAREKVVKSFINEIIYSHSHNDYLNNAEVMKKTLETEILERLRLEFENNKIAAIYVSNYLYQ